MQTASHPDTTQPTQTHQNCPLSFIWIAIATTLISASTALVLTKPNKQAYVEHVAPHFTNEVQTTYCQGPTLPKELNLVGKTLRSICRSAISGGAAAIGKEKLHEFVSGNSKVQQDYVLFNILTTEFPGKTITKVGILGQFITVSNGDR